MFTVVHSIQQRLASLRNSLSASLRAGVLAWGMVCVLGWVASTGAADAKSPQPMTGATVAEQSVALAELPKQGRETYALILKGGPFAYDKDGTVFGNRERILPAQKRDYYREYTVKTPYARNRGAKRIVCGGSQPEQPDACYYSDDHYASFKRITP
jgi:ribonuclease T1